MPKSIRKVKFEVTWIVSGMQELELPDTVDIRNRESVLAYIEEHLNSLALPEKSEYIPDTKDFEPEGPLYISLESDPEYDWIDTGEIDYKLRWKL